MSQNHNCNSSPINSFRGQDKRIVLSSYNGVSHVIYIAQELQTNRGDLKMKAISLELIISDIDPHYTIFVQEQSTSSRCTALSLCKCQSHIHRTITEQLINYLSLSLSHRLRPNASLHHCLKTDCWLNDVIALTTDCAIRKKIC